MRFHPFRKQATSSYVIFAKRGRLSKYRSLPQFRLKWVGRKLYGNDRRSRTRSNLYVIKAPRNRLSALAQPWQPLDIIAPFAGQYWFWLRRPSSLR
ncbi:hypothetical protein FA13DRAFT_1283133 [Coprinellus micaceus]|uniref:Uncharacterized protein n=1 Tax=Coprinellus micaceus TaxID=71717 RepID=A0A4Y7R6Y7_COPMI|nr:hypothetical protein FA13DRAFT_1283133 [Coprinellus micaceus]